jgi:2-polyprenyl-6-methoxyphenol hydroxylase-like FAD-dependent oxidoreductase
MPHSVVGAGLVGLTATIALSRLPNVVVQCFERSPGPREIGAWISLHVSGEQLVPRHPFAPFGSQGAARLMSLTMRLW